MVMQEENVPVDEEVTQAKLHEGFINSTIMRILQKYMDLSPHTAQKLSWKKKEEQRYMQISVLRSMSV